MFLGRARPVDAAKAASLAHSFAAGVEALHARELFLAADAAPLRQKDVYKRQGAEDTRTQHAHRDGQHDPGPVCDDALLLENAPLRR